MCLLFEMLHKNPDQTLGEERKNLSTLIHRQVESIRFAWGLKTVGETYRHLIMQEVEQDFSMGYPITYGYRASTAALLFLRFFQRNDEFFAAFPPGVQRIYFTTIQPHRGH